MNSTEILSLIRDLQSPASKLDQTNLSKISFYTIIENCWSNFELKYASKCAKVQSDDHLWKFGILGLELLKELNESDIEIGSSGCVLSLNDEKLIAQLSQLVVCFTIHYNLEEQIGISIEKLSRYGVNLAQKRQTVSVADRNIRLFQVFEIFYQIKKHKNKNLNLIQTYFYRKYLHEFICALVQLNYSPNRHQTDDKFHKWLFNDLYEECDGANLVSNLIMAQGSRPDQHTLWFTSRIGQLLTKCLLRPNSVMNVIRAVLTEINAVSTVTLASDWKKCDIVAKILAQCPKSVSVQDYFKIIAPQIISLYFNQDIKFSRHFLRVAGSIFSLFAQRYPELTQLYLTKPILEGFNDILNLTSDLKISQECFKQEFSKIYIVFVQSTEPNIYVFNQLPIQLIIFLFKVYTQIKSKINCDTIKQNLEELLRFYVKFSPNSVDFLHHLLLSVTDVRYNLNFELFSDDEEMNHNVVIKTSDCNELSIEMVELHTSVLVSLIHNYQEIQINFMIFLLKKLMVEEHLENVGGSKLLLEIEQDIEKNSKEINSKIIYFTQLSKLFSCIDIDLIVKNYDEIIEFCKIMIENFIKFAQNLHDDSTPSELIHLVLSILSVFTTGTIELDYGVKQKLQVVLPGLDNLKNMFLNTEIEDMIDNLYVSIATYLGIKTQKKVLIEQLDEDEYSKAIRDIKDPLIPIKAHGYVELRKLIEKNDPKCIQNLSQVTELSLRGLKSEDSYLYLAAINCMIALTVYQPKSTLDPLIHQFMNGQKLSVEDRLKVGEVLTKTVRNFNELVPIYAPKLINAFLCGLKVCDDEIFKSSCLSNLGETCKLLKYSLTDNIYEILNCLSCLLETDGSVQVKRSASMVLKMIVEGLNKDNFVQVLGSSVKELYKLLVRVKNGTQDDVIKLNCQLTSDYINELMKNSIFPKQSLQKEIKILRP